MHPRTFFGITLVLAALLSGAAIVCSPAASLAGDNYGAIAYSFATDYCGYSYNYGSRAAAEKRALKECSKVGIGCEVIVWFRNNCGALALGSDGQHGYAWAGSKAVAIKKAIEFCENRGGTDCKMRCWSCNSR